MAHAFQLLHGADHNVPAAVLPLYDRTWASQDSALTAHPTADWVLQQLPEAFPEAGPYRYVILDHDAKFDVNVIAFLKDTGLNAKRTSVQAPCQNETAERWVGSARREILDHVIALNESHLRGLMREYVA